VCLCHCCWSDRLQTVSWRRLLQTLENTVVDIGMVMLLIALSATFSYGIVWDSILTKDGRVHDRGVPYPLGCHADHYRVFAPLPDVHGLHRADPDVNLDFALRVAEQLNVDLVPLSESLWC